MKKALIHGAGNIGRRFIGKILSESGYKVCFIDINKNIVNEINRREEYPVKFVTNEDETEVIVKNIGLVETSIGRMVPVMTEEMLEEDALKPGRALRDTSH